tara:strand:- start:1847 stop:2665 length:819 start_codon:yes stop_codon:yes gene_type:complete
MNFSEYTLLSVGDSFAFGQGTVQHPTIIQGISADSDDEQRQEWKKVCNSHSYVKHIEKELNFKQSVNLALPGCSDELSLINAEAWLNKNPKEKVFLLFSLTDPQRQIFFDKEKQIDFLNTFKYTSDKNLDYYYGVLNNDISLTFKTYQFRKTLKRFLDTTNIKHYVFSPRDNMDERIVKRRKHWNKTIDEGIDHWNKLGIADDFKNWLNNIEDEKTLGKNYLTINKLLAEKQEITIFDWLKKTENPLSSYDNHYNKKAHSTIGIHFHTNKTK